MSERRVESRTSVIIVDEDEEADVLPPLRSHTMPNNEAQAYPPLSED